MEGAADNQIIPVPEIASEDLANWMYQNQSQIRLCSSEQQALQIPEPRILIQIIEQALASDAHWLLLDGPRGERTYWLIDPWWSEAPEMKSRMVELTQARACNLEALRSYLLRVEHDKNEYNR